MIKLFVEPVLIAIVAFVYAEILTEQGMIFGRLYSILKKLPAPVFNPLIGCVYCVAGQMSLWLYLVRYWSEWNIYHHVLYISFAIFAIRIIVTLNDKLTK